MPKTKIAIMYDFDKTLSPEDMQNYGFIQSLNMTPKEFWDLTAEITEKYAMDKILSYMYVMKEESQKRGIQFTKELLRSYGKNVSYFKGVETWFKRINEYAESKDAKVEHYIISSGIKEIIEGCSIAKEFKRIYACEYVYGNNKEAIWPKIAVNFTNKTQYIFRISKDALNVTDDDTLNQATQDDDRRVFYQNMIYIGDGMTDIPCMKLLRTKGGRAIALYPKSKPEKVARLVNEERINYVCAADYQENSDLEKIVKLMIDNMVSLSKLLDKEQKTLEKYSTRQDKINQDEEN